MIITSWIWHHPGLVCSLLCGLRFIRAEFCGARHSVSQQSVTPSLCAYHCRECVLSWALSCFDARSSALALSCFLLFGIQNNEPASYPKRSRQPTNQNHQPWQNESCVPTQRTHTHSHCLWEELVFHLNDLSLVSQRLRVCFNECKLIPRNGDVLHLIISPGGSFFTKACAIFLGIFMSHLY
jgi:hypothetical protein